MLSLRLDDSVYIHSRFMKVISDIITANRGKFTTIEILGTREGLLSVLIGLDRCSLPTKVDVYVTFDGEPKEVCYEIQIRAVERILPDKKKVYCIALPNEHVSEYQYITDTGPHDSRGGDVIW